MKAVRIAPPKDGQPWRPPIIIGPNAEDELMAKALRRLKPLEDPFRLRLRGQEPGTRRPRHKAAEHWTAALLDGPVGRVARLFNEDGKGIVGRIVDVDPQPADTIGSPGVDLIVGLLFDLFPGQWENWGIYNFRRIDGSSSWSDHAYVQRGRWCGRALDVHPATSAIGDKQVAAVERELGSHLRYVLWRGAVGHFPGHWHASTNDAGNPGAC